MTRAGELRLDRASPPPPGPVRPFRFPAFERRSLGGGLTLLAAPVRHVPLACAALAVPGGGLLEEPDAAGLASLTADLLDEGTAGRSGPEIAAYIETLGGSLATAADWNATAASIELLAPHLKGGLELLGEIVAAATFPADELERVRRRRLTELLQRRDSPGWRAEEVVARALYGDGVYGTPLLGTPDSLAKLRREDVVAFYRLSLTPHGGTLAAAGDFDVGELTAAAEEVFGGWRGGPPPSLPILTPPTQERRVVILNRPRAAQTELRIAHPGPPRRHPDWIPLQVMNGLLGGKFTSRLNLSLRERHGYTYGVHSHFAARLGPGPFAVSAAVATEHAGDAAREILTELERLRQEPVAADELEETRSYLLGVFPYTLQTVSDLVRRLQEVAVFGLPDDHFDRLPEELAAVDRDAVLRVARAHLRPETAAIVAVGPLAALEPQLAGLGPVTALDPGSA